MGQSTNGQICYGILFEEGYEFPWKSEKDDGDIEDWWLYEVHNFKHSFEIYDENGGYLNDTKPPQTDIDRYYKEKHDFEKTMPPLLVELVNVCSCDYPIYILAIGETFVNAWRGDPTEISTQTLNLPENANSILSDFCKNYRIEYSTPQWWLSSLWC